MIHRIDYRKAIIAGTVGAIAWEALQRPLVLVGVPIIDIVTALGSVAAPGSDALTIWATGMLLHLLVGAIWGVFYAYFFWSALPYPPVVQGLIFSFIPMALAILVMHPQLQLMGVSSAEHLSAAQLYGFGDGWQGLSSIVVGHLIWGAVLGVIYTRPVGYQSYHPPHLRASRPPQRPATLVGPDCDPGDDCFMFATGIECSYPTIDDGRWRMDEMAACDHYRLWRTDLALVRKLGLRFLRYGPPLHLISKGPGRYDWDFLDDVAAEMQRLGIVPIMDLCHFGVPNWLGNFQNPELPHALADYARAFAKRYPWVKFYTPVNEMYVCAKLSALDGIWNEQRRDERAFVTAVRGLASANVLMMQAIAAERPDAIFVNSESGEFFQPCCPDPRVVRIADFENERRFLPLDLIYAHPVRDDVRTYLMQNGMPADEYAWFMQQDTRRRSILGVDYYEWNEKLIDTAGRAETLGELFGWYVIASQYYERYRRPMMHTETNRLDAREGPRWLWRQWHNVHLIRTTGVPVVGFTWYSLTDQVDWDIALRAPLGNVNPVGLFDLNRDPRPVGIAYKYLIDLFKPELRNATSIERLLLDAEQRRMTEARELA